MKDIRKETLSFNMVFNPKATLGLNYLGISTGKPLALAKADSGKVGDYELSTGIPNSDMFKDFANQDIVPKDEDFINVPFRLISATTVGAGSWKATDFSGKGLLKNSMSKLLGKTVYKDHDQESDTWVGYVKALKYGRAFTNADGIRVPSGIDGILAIDSKVDPKLVRGLMLGTVYSNSVTVAFNWKPSHEYKDSWDFMRNVGSMHEDGKMVRRIVTEIEDYHETSLCWLGADPYAKAYDPKGNLVHIDEGHAYEDDSEIKSFSENQSYSISSCLNKKIISLSGIKETAPKKINKQTIVNEMKKELLDKLRLALGLAAEAEITEAHIASLSVAPANQTETINKAMLFDKVLELNVVSFDKPETSKVTLIGEKEKTALPEKFAEEFVLAKKVDVDATTAKVVELSKDLATAKEFEAAGKQAVEFKRGELIRLYKVGTNGGDAKVIETFEKAEAAALDGLLEQFTKGATAKFTATCKSCKGTDITFKSSMGDNKDEETTVSSKPISMADMVEKKNRSGFGYPTKK